MTNKSSKLKTERLWAVWEPKYGFHSTLYRTRRDVLLANDLGWYGRRVVRVTVTPVKRKP